MPACWQLHRVLFGFTYSRIEINNIIIYWSYEATVDIINQINWHR